MGTTDDAKVRVARFAAERYVRTGMRLALGTGSTAAEAVRALAACFPGERFECVASSRATEALARSLGFAVRDLLPEDRFDVMLDGADEVAPNLDLTKGGGGALFREKLLASLSDRVVILVDASKLVPALGTRHPIPVEVVPFAAPVLERDLEREQLRPKLRRGTDGRAAVTDNGNLLLDLFLAQPLHDPASLHSGLKARIGVVETGLFLGLADRVVVGEPSGTVRELPASASGAP